MPRSLACAIYKLCSLPGAGPCAGFLFGLGLSRALVSRFAIWIAAAVPAARRAVFLGRRIFCMRLLRRRLLCFLLNRFLLRTGLCAALTVTAAAVRLIGLFADARVWAVSRPQASACGCRTPSGRPPASPFSPSFRPLLPRLSA